MSNPETHPFPGGRLLAILLGLPVARLLFHLIHQPDIQPNAVLEIGVPAAGAFALTLLAPAPRSATGRLLKGATVLLLVAWGLFSLSGLTLLTISPLFYATSMIVGLALDTAQRTAAFDARLAATRAKSPPSAPPPPRPGPGLHQTTRRHRTPPS